MYGFYDSTQIDLGANIDAAYLETLQTRAGVDYARILAELQGRLTGLNGAMEPFVASLIAAPSVATTSNGTGVTPFKVQPGLEYGIPRPQKSSVQKYPTPIAPWQMSLGFTEQGLDTMSLDLLTQTMDSFVEGWRVFWRKEALRRLFSPDEYPVDEGTTMLSPGFAGSGTGLNAFTRPYPDGSALPANYTLYYRIAAGDLDTDLLPVVQELRRWQQGPFDLVAPQAELELIAAINPGNPVTGFVAATSNLVTLGSASAGAQVDPMIYAGVLFGDVRVRLATQEYDDPNIAIYKSYGPMNARNALGWRYDAQKGRGVMVKSRSLVPLDQAWGEQWAGMYVNNRTAAALVRVGASGDYEPPTIDE